MEQVPTRTFRCRKKNDTTNESALDLNALKAAINSGEFEQADLIWDDDSSTWLTLISHATTAPLFSQTLWDAWDESSSFTVISDLRASKNTAIPTSETLEEDDDHLEPPLHVTQGEQAINDIVELDDGDISPLVNTEVNDDIIPLSETDLQPLSNPDIPVDKRSPAYTTTTLPTRSSSPSKKDMLPIEAAIFGVQHSRSKEKTRRFSPPSSYGFNPGQTLDRQAAEALGDMLLPPRREPKKARSSLFYGFNWVRMALIIAPLALIGWAYLSVIDLEVSQNLNQEVRQSTVQKQLSDMQIKEASLREKLQREKIQLINLDNSFERALLIGLSNMNINALEINAPVKGWAGRRLDKPSKATVDVRIQSKGETAIELATIALVVGKYMTANNMTIDTFTIRFDEDGIAYSHVIRPALAEKFFLERIDMTEFLETQLQQSASE